MALLPESDLDRALSTLDLFLALLGFRQHTFLRAIASWIAFLLLSLALPLFAIHHSTWCAPAGSCDKFEIQAFELQIILSRALVAAVALLCISRKLRKYGIRKMLFVDRCHGRTAHFLKHYIHKIRGFYVMLASWFGFCFLLKAAREVTRLVYLYNGFQWFTGIFILASLLSWAYTTLVFLSGCALFNLVGNLLVTHLENFGKVLEKDLEVSAYIEEHMGLMYELSKFSHRFRMFILFEFLFVTACQLLALFQTLENHGIINFVNAGDFAVLSIVQLVGLILCLTVATKITTRAQGLGSVASRWHALVTSNSNDPPGVSGTPSDGNTDFLPPVRSVPMSYSESDLESPDYVPLPSNLQLFKSTLSYERRQAFVTYVQSNTGGFTIYGWMMDRMLINTLFFTELNLVFFVLGRTIS